MTSPLLKISNLSKSYGALKVTNNVNLDVQQGEIHALIGPNGGGKTSLISQIAGEVVQDEGRLYLQDEEITELSVVSRARKGLGRTFQVSALALDFTVLENVILGSIGATGAVYRIFKPALKNNTIREMAFDALERVGIKNLALMLTGELSHGQRRQLEVAIALTLKPNIFLMDEPMAGLGVSGTKKMIDLLSTLKQEAPILLVEHDMDAVFALADRISVLVYGKIIITGTADEVRNNEKVRIAYLGEED